MAKPPMAETKSQTWTRRFASPPEAIWPLLSDTARFNEAAGLPKHEIEERPRPDGSVEFRGRARMGPFRLEWLDKPANWVANRWFEHCRSFTAGPLATLCAHFSLVPEDGGCRARYTVEAAPAGVIGRLLLRFGFLAGAGRTFESFAESAAGFALGERDTPFDYEPPEPDPDVRARVAGLVERIERTGHGHGLAGRLADHLLGAQEVDLAQIRPLRLARLWAVLPRHAIELCLEAARQGLLELRWALLCPRCRVAKASVGALDTLPKGAHCDTCNIDYDAEFSRNVELSFQPAATVRPISFGEYCLFGPMSTPHIHVQLTLAPGESRTVEATLAPGAYRLRTLEPGPQRDIELRDGGFPEVIFEPGAMAAGPAAAPGELCLANRGDRERTLIVEELRWTRDALTADRVSTLQAFRDLFSDQVLRPGDEVAMRRLAVMFTDLSQSTALYAKVGDARAYHLVRDHFAFLAGVVREHDGAVVKTIGDAVMAAFAEPADALQAALDVQRGAARFNEAYPDTPIAIKLGLHEGSCIAVTLNDRLDYFGTTVNLAARLQDESRGGDVVLSRAMAEDPAVAALLDGFATSEEEAALKGFDQPVAFLRLADLGGQPGSDG